MAELKISYLTLRPPRSPAFSHLLSLIWCSSSLPSSPPHSVIYSPGSPAGSLLSLLCMVRFLCICSSAHLPHFHPLHLSAPCYNQLPPRYCQILAQHTLLNWTIFKNLKILRPPISPVFFLPVLIHNCLPLSLSVFSHFCFFFFFGC